MAPAQQKVLEQTGERGICIDDPVSKLDLPPEGKNGNLIPKHGMSYVHVCLFKIALNKI